MISAEAATGFAHVFERRHAELARLVPLLTGSTETADDLAAAPAAVSDVREAPARLPFRVRACVVLRHAFGLSERQTARILRLPVGAVRRRTAKGTARLRRLLGARAVDHLRSVPHPSAGRRPPARPR
ncbi:hypothetical protein GCM10018781_66620 [Kitasatospora indigofera]|uniref:RNA polymerase sigma factor 70 region 4 type 2 domain-containing protein n=1 Tax=Kitasatospora indigofera TaxID=67307 RepID=A0A919GCY8_9ACTN|nr:sigma factor-like helix-turn-helix DNA-binding protein [Kitasatospora indigofera]GHH82190.1 hypothetical protein GCM10018781_66620 [Kitasatospora indigofera]